MDKVLIYQAIRTLLTYIGIGYIIYLLLLYIINLNLKIKDLKEQIKSFSNMTLWIYEKKTLNSDNYIACGVFDSKEKAIEICNHKTDSIFPISLNTTIESKQSEYPLQEEEIEMDRYRFINCTDNLVILRHELHSNGEWVKYKDVKELEEENERLNNTLKQILDYYINVMGDVTGKIIPCDIADEARRLGVIE